MILTLDLPPELETQLSQEATEMGMSLAEYVLYRLTLYQSGTLFHAGKALVRYWQDEGVIGSRPDIGDSQAYARQLRQMAEAQQEGAGDPWFRYAGMWADDPDWDIFQAEVAAFRQVLNAQTGANHEQLDEPA